MVDLYVSPGKQKNRKERISVSQLKKLITRTGTDSYFTALSTFPTKTHFETQEDDEVIVLFIRQHLIVNLPWVLMAIFLLTLPSVFVFFPAYAILPANFQFILVLGWYLFVFGYSLAKFMGWFFNIYILTDERIVDVDFKNIFFRKISTAKIEEIQDVNVQSSGAFQTFFGYGSIFVQTAAAVPEFDFLRIPHPDKVGKIIAQLIDHEEQEKLEGRVK